MKRLLAALAAIPFYQSPHSLFPSGESSLLNLEKNKISIQKEASFLVEKDRRNFWVSSRDLVRDSDLSENTAITVTSTQIREMDSWKSPYIATLPAGTKLQIVKLKETWAEVIFESVGKIQGWIDLNNLILKADFAAFIQVKGKDQWQTVRYREGTQLITEDNLQIDLDRVSKMKTKPDLGISIAQDERQNLLIRQHLKIIKNDNDQWNVSKLSGHGAVYWKSSASLSPANTEIIEPGISTDDLLKREVVSVSFHPKNPKIGLASAQGIYMTLDGKIWRPIKSFGQKFDEGCIGSIHTTFFY
jgi:hypothetical protein